MSPNHAQHMARLEIRRSNHINNIEHEAEVVKGILYDICTQTAIMARDLGHAAIAAKFYEFREELGAVYPKRRT